MAKSKFPKGIAKDIIIVVVGVLIIWMGLRVVFGTENPFYVVSSGSMVPELLVFDVLVVQGNDPFESVIVGDIIVFDRPSDHDRVIVHRVAAITIEDPFTIRTKGDANPASIPGTDFPITEEEFIGKVAYVIPQVGYVTRILTPPINYIIIAIIIAVMITKEVRKRKKEHSLSESFEFESKSDDVNESENVDETKIPEDKEYSRGLEEKNNPNDKENSEDLKKSDSDFKSSKDFSDSNSK
jgi:signal peptidase